jgi:hypothetical protein
VGDYCRKMKSTIGLHDLGVHGPGARPSSQRSAGPSQQLRGRADAAHAPAVNTHLPLQVRDALTLELTRPPPPHTPASTTSSASSSTSRALVVAPPPSFASLPASLLGAPPPGPNGGGWGRGGRRGRGGGSWDAHPGSDPSSRSSSRRYALAELL